MIDREPAYYKTCVDFVASDTSGTTTPSLQTVRFLVRLFQIVKEHVKEDDCNFCKSILIEASRDTQK
jgi:hypothetical protein